MHIIINEHQLTSPSPKTLAKLKNLIINNADSNRSFDFFRTINGIKMDKVIYKKVSIRNNKEAIKISMFKFV